ncbi:MAG: diacylglycerol kinase family protein [Bacteroidales bacterium]|nr:diacylglycerol kinase family protein [Bacteroidales bacterium]
MKKNFSIKARLASFKNAWRGVTVFIRQEHNAWIHCTITVLVIIAGLLFHISTAEWIAVFFAIGLVLAAEAINSAIERLSDVVQPEKDERIRDIKDISAGAVFICAITAAIIGVIIFLPKLLMLF